MSAGRRRMPGRNHRPRRVVSRAGKTTRSPTSAAATRSESIQANRLVGAKELPAKKKLTFAERLELQKIDKEMPKLEARKQELLVILAKGGTDHHAMMQQSMDLEKVMKELDRISDRWLELSERAEG